MSSNWVKQAVTVGGVGQLTLGPALSGRITLGEAFVDGHTDYYSIEDGNDREIGVGTYNATGITLIRNTVLETLVGGVFNNTNPVAINVTTSATVAISAVSQLLPAHAKTVLKTGYHDFSDAVTNSDTITQGLNGNQWFIPVYFDRPREINQVGFNITTSHVGNTIKIGAYHMQEDGQPGGLIFESGTIDDTSIATVMVSITARKFCIGWHWFALTANNAYPAVTASQRGSNTKTMLGINIAGNGRSVVAYTKNWTTNLPDPAPDLSTMTDYSGGNLPLILFGLV